MRSSRPHPGRGLHETPEAIAYLDPYIRVRIARAPLPFKMPTFVPSGKIATPHAAATDQCVCHSDPLPASNPVALAPVQVTEAGSGVLVHPFVIAPIDMTRTNAVRLLVFDSRRHVPTATASNCRWD